MEVEHAVATNHATFIVCLFKAEITLFLLREVDHDNSRLWTFFSVFNQNAFNILNISFERSLSVFSAAAL